MWFCCVGSFSLGYVGALSLYWCVGRLAFCLHARWKGGVLPRFGGVGVRALCVCCVAVAACRVPLANTRTTTPTPHTHMHTRTPHTYPHTHPPVFLGRGRRGICTLRVTSLRRAIVCVCMGWCGGRRVGVGCFVFACQGRGGKTHLCVVCVRLGWLGRVGSNVMCTVWGGGGRRGRGGDFTVFSPPQHRVGALGGTCVVPWTYLWG